MLYFRLYSCSTRFLWYTSKFFGLFFLWENWYCLLWCICCSIAICYVFNNFSNTSINLLSYIEFTTGQVDSVAILLILTICDGIILDSIHSKSITLMNYIHSRLQKRKFSYCDWHLKTNVHHFHSNISYFSYQFYHSLYCIKYCLSP